MFGLLINSLKVYETHSEVQVTVYSRFPLSTVDIIGLLSRDNRFVCDMDAEDAYTVLLERSDGAADAPRLAIQQSVQLDREHLADWILNQMAEPLYSVVILSEMTFDEAAQNDDLADLCKIITDAGEGFAAYDPYEMVLYASNKLQKPNRRVKSVQPENRPLIEFVWCIACSVDDDLAALFNSIFDVWYEYYPKIFPFKYGTPARQIAERESQSTLVSAIIKDSFMTVGRAPLPIINVFLHKPQDPRAWKNGGIPYAKVTLSFLLDAFCQDLAFAPQMEQLFVETARRAGACFASAIVQRENTFGAWKFSQRILDNYRLTFGPWWQGLPSLPVWWAWYGVAYAPLVHDAINGAGRIIDYKGEGLFLKMSDKPLNIDELARLFPLLPADLVAHEIIKPTDGKTVSSREYASAVHMPQLFGTRS